MNISGPAGSINASSPNVESTRATLTASPAPDSVPSPTALLAAPPAHVLKPRSSALAVAALVRRGQQEPAAAAHADVASKREVATGLCLQAQLAEPHITSALIELGARFGGELHGLEHRLKTVDSLARKLETTPAAWITDTLRYTLKFEPNNLGAGAKGVLDSLNQAGNKSIVVSNTFKHGGPYAGINATMRSPGEQIFEVQMHTPQSLEVKELNHGLYEQYRSLPVDDARRGALMDKMVNNVAKIRIPDGVQEQVPTVRNF